MSMNPRGPVQRWIHLAGPTRRAAAAGRPESASAGAGRTGPLHPSSSPAASPAASRRAASAGGRTAAFRSVRPPRRSLVSAATLLAVLAAALGVSTPAHAAAVHYAALGDSYSSGVGADDYDFAAGICLRGSHAYPALWAASHAPASFDFPACAGATTADVLNKQLGVLSAQTTLVSLTIGGNDIGFANVVLACKFATTQACADAVAGAENQARTTLPAKLAATYAAITSRAPNARLVVLGYPRLFETTSCGLFSMSVVNRQALNHGADVLESVISAAAQSAGARYVSLQSWFTGHRVCASVPWINGTVPIAVDSYHPNASGYSRAYLPALVSVTG